MPIVTYTGDVLQSGANVIAHQVNCKGVMGAGIALQIRKAYPDVYRAYRTVCLNTKIQRDLLGKILPCPLNKAKDKWIVNCFAQIGLGTSTRQTDYAALEMCFQKLKCWAVAMGYTRVAVPHGIGCGLAGGSWDFVRNILEKTFTDERVTIEIWKLPE